MCGNRVRAEDLLLIHFNDLKKWSDCVLSAVYGKLGNVFEWQLCHCYILHCIGEMIYIAGWTDYLCRLFVSWVQRLLLLFQS